MFCNDLPLIQKGAISKESNNAPYKQTIDTLTNSKKERKSFFTIPSFKKFSVPRWGGMSTSVKFITGIILLSIIAAIKPFFVKEALISASATIPQSVKENNVSHPSALTIAEQRKKEVEIAISLKGKAKDPASAETAKKDPKDTAVISTTSMQKKKLKLSWKKRKNQEFISLVGNEGFGIDIIGDKIAFVTDGVPFIQGSKIKNKFTVHNINIVPQGNNIEDAEAIVSLYAENKEFKTMKFRIGDRYHFTYYDGAVSVKNTATEEETDVVLPGEKLTSAFTLSKVKEGKQNSIYIFQLKNGKSIATVVGNDKIL